MGNTLLVALGSGLATLLFWLVLVLSGFLLVGFSFGWQLRRLVPENRDRLPRKVWVAACLLASLVIGGLSGLDVGGGQAVLAMGDALVSRQFTLRTPLSDIRQETGGAWGAATRLEESIISELGSLRGMRWVGYAGGHLLLGSWYDPTVMTLKLGRTYLSLNQEGGGASMRETWLVTRPELAEQGMRKITASLLLGSLYLLGLILFGALVLLISWKELRAGLAPPNRADLPPSGL